MLISPPSSASNCMAAAEGPRQPTWFFTVTQMLRKKGSSGNSSNFTHGSRPSLYLPRATTPIWLRIWARDGLSSPWMRKCSTSRFTDRSEYRSSSSRRLKGTRIFRTDRRPNRFSPTSSNSTCNVSYDGRPKRHRTACRQRKQKSPSKNPSPKPQTCQRFKIT